MYFTLKNFPISINSNFHTQVDAIRKKYKTEALSMWPRQPSMESSIRRLEKFKLVSNGNITNKIPIFRGLFLFKHIFIMYET